MSFDLALAASIEPIFILVALVAVAVLAFEIVMIINAIHNENISATAKTWWVVGMFLVHPFVAFAYYFTDYSKRRDGSVKV